MAYLDYAGAGKASEEQMKAVSEDMLQLKLSNPHSAHQSGQFTAAVIDRVRTRVLRHFNVTSDSHAVIFTSGATEALKIIAESFDFGKHQGKCLFKTTVGEADRGIFVYMWDAHTSVVGMREIVRKKCNAVCVVNFEDLQNLKTKPDSVDNVQSNDLFAITAMSNFCGRKYNLSIINTLRYRRPGKSFVCLDAAAWASTTALDLSIHKADFAVISFYKIFGFPTGTGALIVRLDSAEALKKQYFGGGTIRLLVPDEFAVFRRIDLSQRFEDGTINYWSIAALEHGFEDLEKFGGMAEIEKKTHELACAARKVLSQKYQNGATVAKLYEHTSNAPSSAQGPIVTFNLLRDDGSYVGYAEVDKMCTLYGIELRTGCFCNQGACQKYLQISHEEQMSNFKMGKECGDKRDLNNGKPLGAVRISFGRQSKIEDVSLFGRMLQTCYLSKQNIIQEVNSCNEGSPTLIHIAVYPIKSCTAFRPQRWALESTGLKYDRLWMITSKNGVYLSLKRVPQLHLIEPQIKGHELMLTSRVENSGVSVPLEYLQDTAIEEQRVCADRVNTVECGEEAAAWISRVISTDGCRLRRKANDSSSRICSLKNSSKPPLGLSNEAPYLLINKNSVAQLASTAGMTTDEAVSRFRANFVIDGIEPFTEDKILRIQIGKVWFTVVGKCTRCQIICFNPETGENDPSIMLALRDYRINSKLTFGIYLQHDKGSEGEYLEIGMAVKIIWQPTD